ncbi:IclR family transcriptional regulator domain-containing protein [Aquimixticola soesokkakensis]|nr:IclR family transcriptional regulator C-terminal domain-containing protein [Aquimixticola soesokkakensis]
MAFQVSQNGSHLFSMAQPPHSPAPPPTRQTSAQTGAPKTENVAAVLKVFGVLEALCEEGESSLAQIAQKVMASKSTAHRLLQTMVDLGYVEQDGETEQYRLTLKLFSQSARALEGQSQILRIADRGMGALSRATGEAINLGMLDKVDQRVLYIHQKESAYSLSMRSAVGTSNPVHSTALGKALLAWREPQEIAERISRIDFTPKAPRTILDADSFRTALDETRAQGFAEEIEEAEEGVRCLAVPLLNHIGTPVAAISVSFPLFRYDEARRAEYIDLLTRVSQEASLALGYQG